MARTILQHGQAAARAIGVEPPSAFVGATDDTAARILQAMQDAGLALAARDWLALRFEHTFSTAPGQTEYPLPTVPSWHHIVPGTVWDRTNASELRGAMSPRAWQQQIGSGQVPTLFARPWRLQYDTDRTLYFTLQDDPNGVYVIALEYVTDQWAYNGISAYAARATADTDLPVYDDYLFELATRWRVERALGLGYQETQLEAQRRELELFAQERPRGLVHLARGPYYSNTAEGSWAL
jgi:hypothetical protein